MLSTMPNTADLSNVETPHSGSRIFYALETLLSLSRRNALSERSIKLFPHEVDIVDECFTIIQNDLNYSEYYISVVREALSHGHDQLIKTLLSKDVTGCLLEGTNDLLQIAICTRYKGHWQMGLEFSQLLVELTRLLMKHGAPVNSCDARGNTALYYACVYGFFQTFELLINSGAVYHTLHATIPSEDIDICNDTTRKAIESTNLLQIALNARLADEKNCFVTRIWDLCMDMKGWSSIITCLISRGLRAQPDDPALLKFFHLACAQGNRRCVSAVLEHGVEFLAKAGRCRVGDVVFGSPLHAATTGGQPEIVRMLVQAGMSPSLLALHTHHSNTREKPVVDGVPSANMKPSDDNRIFTPIGVALRKNLHPYDWRDQMTGSFQNKQNKPPIESEVIESCKILVELGANEIDCKFLLQSCPEWGASIDLIQWLFHRGIIITSTPLCRDMATVKCFVENGATLDPAKFQHYATMRGTLELLKFLVDNFGSHLNVDEDMGDIILQILQRYDMDMLKYLACDYLDHIDVTFWRYRWIDRTPENRVDLLRVAYLEQDLALLQLLLDWGANPDNCRLGQSHIDYAQNMLESDPHQQYWTSVLQLLLSKSSLKSYKFTTNNLDHNTAIDPQDGVQEDSIQLLLSHEPLSRQREKVGNLGPMFLDTGEMMTASSGRQRRQIFEQEQSLKAQQSSMHHKTGTQALRTSQISENKDQLSPTSLSLAPICPKSSVIGDRFKYQQLPGLSYIRLLIVEPSSDVEDPIRCNLMTTMFARVPKYEAVSHTWVGSEQSVTINVNSLDFLITANMASALARLRYKDRQRTLWIDAICINQTDVDEKQKQIPIMRDIFSGAEQVVAWVGEAADDSHLLFEHIDHWKRITNWEDQQRDDMKRINFLMGTSIDIPPLSKKIYHAYRKFCLRPYFFRTWIIQEIALAKHVVVVCGADIGEWSILARIPGESVSGSSWNPFTGMNSIAHVHELWEVCRRPHDTDSMFSDVLRHSIHHRSTDPRDKIYGLLGILSSIPITIDYRLSTAEVFRKAAVRIIETTGELSLWDWFSSCKKTQGLPSWVPDFDSDAPLGAFGGMRTRYLNIYLKLGTNLPIMSGWRVEGYSLVVRGMYLATVNTKGRIMQTQSDAQRQIQDLRETLQQWEEIARCMTPAPASTAKAFLNTITGDIQDPDDVDAHAWYNRYGANVLRSADPEYFSLLAHRAKNSEEYGEIADVDEFSRCVMQSCYGRRFFTTDHGAMGISHPEIEVGDLVVYFPGAIHPVVIRGGGDGNFTLIGNCHICPLDKKELCKHVEETAIEYSLC